MIYYGVVWFVREAAKKVPPLLVRRLKPPRIRLFFQPDPDPLKKKCRILIPAIHGIIFDCDTLSSLNAYICISKISNRHKLCHCVFDRNMFDVFIRSMNRGKIMRFTSIFINKTKKTSLHKFFWRKAFL